MPKGPVPHASDRPAGGRNSGPSLDEFLDAFQGYHQIPLALEDQEKIAFETPTGNYHYKVMPFGLKNVGSTYQRMMTRMFKPQLGQNIEIYVDDMVVKSKVVSEHLEDLGGTFNVLMSQPFVQPMVVRPVGPEYYRLLPQGSRK